MAAKLQAIRGIHDILPGESAQWQWLEARVREVLASYGYSEIRLPILEKTELFKRSIGEVTDIVEKEMYTFDDRNGDSLTLRPEGTASCVRACLEHGLLHNQTQRLWYQGPMFRHERPQKGRYRQFHQIGVEAYGLAGPDIDLEVLLLSARLWRALGLGDLELQINTLGTSDERRAYREQLVGYLNTRIDELDEDSRRRLGSNPLRVLDSKDPGTQAVVADAPALTEALGDESRAHLDWLCEGLTRAGIAHVINPRLVRGLDYYSRTVFEWVTDRLGAQGTVCAGGRYDGLVEQLGGRATPAVGFAMGLERLLALIADQVPERAEADVYLVLVGDSASAAGMTLAEKLRDELPGIRIQSNCGGGSFKAQFKRADKSGARFALVLGEDEVTRGVATLKALRSEAGQEQVAQSELGGYLSRVLSRSAPAHEQN